MNIDIIKNTTFALSDKYFQEIHHVIDTQYLFIDKYKLQEPKGNYFYSYKFLHTTMNYFLNIDNTFSTKTLLKLQQDIMIFHNLYKVSKKNISSAEDIFYNHILPDLDLLAQMKEEASYLNTSKTISAKATLKIVQEQRSQMKKIYYQCFLDEYTQQIKDISYSLTNIINIKLFYFDNMLWNLAQQSYLIKELLQDSNNKVRLDATVYIKHKLNKESLSKDEYQYLENCLRTYR